jgi:Spy/CpxP family protein refolding chaperone
MWAQAAQAPAPGGQHAMTARGGARMFQGLNLSEDQRAKVQTILQGERSQIQALRSNTSLSEEQKKQQARELRQANHQQLLAILTPEQQAKMKQVHGQRMGRHAAFNAGRRFQALNLTDQQKSQLKPVFESSRQQMQALRSDTSLTPELRREKMQQIRQNQMAQMKSILTPEQQQQMQQMRGRHFHRGGDKPAIPNGF